MNNFLSPFAIILLSVLTLFSCTNVEQQKNDSYKMKEANAIPAPQVKKIPKELTIHGDTRIDNYYWLNDRNNPEVIQYLKNENKYTEEIMQPTEPLQEKIYEEIVGRIKKDDESVPYKDNGYYYLTKYEKGKEYPIYSRKKGSLEGEEELLLDVNQLAEGYEFYQVGGRSVSPDNKLMVYGEDTLSRRLYTLRIKNLETGELLPDVIQNTIGSAVWANDNKTIFYAKKDETTLRPYQIYRHVLGTDVKDDVLIYTEDDDTFVSYVYKTKSEKYILIGSYATLTNEIRYLDANNPTGVFQMFEPRNRDEKLEYSVSHFNDQWYIKTNWKAENFRLMRTPEGNTSKDAWEEVIPHRSDVLMESFDLFDDYLVLTERIKGITEIRIKPWEGEEHYIKFDEEAHMAYTSTNLDFDTEVVRIGYQSMITPNSTYDYNMRTKEKTLLKQQEVVGDFSSSDYASERLYATANDGTKVPISMAYKKGVKKDGSNPLLLYGYGSYGASMNPSFNSARLSLLDRGFIFAIAHIRGGEEMGRAWYENGKLLKKKNTFTDFIDCAEFLLEANYTTKEKLFALGGSAGGLLMGAVINERPDLWKGVIAAVPFVDVVTTMLDESIPLTTGEYDEWGNPNDKEYYDYIKSYSPYDNIEAKDYPNLLVTTGLHDSQVQYWEPAKWVAKLRELKTDDHLLLLHTNMGAGHGGASGRFKRYKETAMEYAFLISLANNE